MDCVSKATARNRCAGELPFLVTVKLRRQCPGPYPAFAPYMKAGNSVRPSIYTLYLYALAKSGRLSEASVHIARLDADGRARADVKRFLNWFTTKFELSSLKDGGRMSHR